MFHYVRMDCEGIENYYHSYGSLPYQSEYSFQNCALFLSSFTAAGEFAINFPILIQEVVRMLIVFVPSIYSSILILESRHYTSGGSQ